MKVLVIGSGGREHAIAWKLKQSRHVKKLYVAPGNAGISLIANSVSIKADNIGALINFVERHHIDMTVVGPEVPLAMGIVDSFEKKGLKIFGPTKAAAELESSKAFAKEFMRKYHIPTAPFQIFTDATQAVSFIKSAPLPLVIKASGLAAGKGAVVVRTQDEAIETIDNMMTKKIFGEAGDTVVVENFLDGQELSVMAFSDGKNIQVMLPSQDHKQIGEGDTGPNTGGMGAFCPADLADSKTNQFIVENILMPTITGMAREGRPYKGVLYAGLMLTPAGPKVIEFNCRFGDPETQVVLPLLKSDLADIFMAVIDGNLMAADDPIWDKGASACIILSSKGYPGKTDIGKRIFGLRNYSDKGCQLFHSATRKDGKNWVSSGGRVVGVSSIDHDLPSALSRAYSVVDQIKFDGMYYRSDIGFRMKHKVKIGGV